MKKTVYIIGHKNPDTDSVISAAAYAQLKHDLGEKNHIAARAGKLAPQTEYIFERFHVPVPEYIPDLQPKTEYYMQKILDVVDEKTSLSRAVAKMEESNSKVLPVIDAKGVYKSLLHYNAFAQNILKILNPDKETAITTSIKLIKDTLSAQPLITRNENELFKCSILVAASKIETFKELLEVKKNENVIVITGDRADIQEHCIDCDIKALVITSGFILNKELREKAEKKGISILTSPYDTSETSLLIVYSTPVSVMADSNIKPVKSYDTIRRIKPLLKASPSRCLPVVDYNNKVIGIISESDIIQDANIELILVDHNELSQAVEGAEHYIIREIIDHHRLGNVSTRNPITFINKPVGATCTLITNLYRENKISIPTAIASILLCGILSDTLILQSATTTTIDLETAEYLSNITNLDIQQLGQDIMSAASNIGKRTATEVIHQDMKEYTEGKHVFTVSQIEVDSTSEIRNRKEEFIAELEIERRSRKGLFSAIMVTNITKLTSILIIAAEPAFMPYISLPKRDDAMYTVKDIVSRKKQLIPLLLEQIEKFSI
ncbi:MAG TPA: putative manganese-dependent inorganic diphosphatase [Treponemataceae bacterium]|nr:putative manganese-dependent inorganic diphosphatase [Treponemataceae bacterium]